MGNLLRKLSLPLLLSATCVAPLFAQEEQNLYDLSLEELMNVAIVSASSQEETLFDAPVSSYSITKDEISKSGATSIPEALRLAPGVIVRETTNGNYDIHLNGFDNPIRYTGTSSQINMISLVMINNRPVFSLGQGGTHWEALPIDLVDVERIEIVRGPSAALFGPNAVTGVINIITKDFSSDNLYVSGNVQTGTPSTSIGNLAIGKKIGEKVNLAISGNFQNRDRHDDLYYLYSQNTYIKSEVFKAEEELEHQMALNKYGVNGYLNYQLSEEVGFDLSVGAQHSNAQKVHYENEIPLTITEKKNAYANIAGKIYGLNTRISLETGEDNLLKEKKPSFSTAYKYHIVDAAIDYQWKINKKFILRPAVNITQSQYDGREFAEQAIGGGLFNGEYKINSTGASLRADWFPIENLRLVGGFRGDKFSVKEDLIYSYQFLATYNLQDKWLFRLVQSNAKSGIFYQQILDLTVPSFMPDGSMLMYNIDADPNDFKAASNTMTEVGVRGKINNRLQLDLSLFQQKLTNLQNLQTTGSGASEQGVPYVVNQYLNLPFELQQIGSTISVNYIPNRKWQIKPFATFQRTETENFAIQPGAQPETKKHDSTPAVFGGLFTNFAPHKKVNINLNSYFFGKQTMYHTESTIIPTQESTIAGKVLVNTKVSYQAYNKFKLYLGAKNLLNQDQREYFGTDRIGASYFAGASYNF